MANISEGGKAANNFLKAQGKHPEFHDGASLANIISGFPVQPEPRFREVERYLRNSALNLKDEALVHELIETVRTAMAVGR